MEPTKGKVVLTWTCEECGKILHSIYPKSLRVQVANHKLSHELRKEEKA